MVSTEFLKIHTMQLVSQLQIWVMVSLLNHSIWQKKIEEKERENNGASISGSPAPLLLYSNALLLWWFVTLKVINHKVLGVWAVKPGQSTTQRNFQHREGIEELCVGPPQYAKILMTVGPNPH